MDALTAEHRSKQLLVRRQTISQTKALVPLLKWDDLDGSFAQLESAMRPVVVKNLATSAGLSSAYIKAMRAKRGPGGRIDPARPKLNPEQFTTSLRVTSLVAAKNAAGRGMAGDLALRHVAILVANSMTRLALDGGRQTVLNVLRSDNAKYARVLGGEGCEFCQMLAGRGAVYSADSADFEAHDKCACTPEPSWA